MSQKLKVRSHKIPKQKLKTGVFNVCSSANTSLCGGMRDARKQPRAIDFYVHCTSIAHDCRLSSYNFH